MIHEVSHWRGLGSRLSIEVKAPAIVFIGGEEVSFTALLPQFGAENGMIAEADCQLMERHAAALIKEGFGYSVVELGVGDDAEDQSAKDMLRDWGWVASMPRPTWW